MAAFAQRMRGGLPQRGARDVDREWTMENSFHRIVSQTMRLYFARNYQVMERLDVHPGQVPVLFEIHRKGGLYQKELCDSLCLRASTVTVMLQRMTKNGLVERRQDEADQRRTRIFLTEKGEAAIRDLRDATQKVEEECFEGFSMEEILLLKRFAMQIRDNLAKRMNDMPENPKREGNLCSS